MTVTTEDLALRTVVPTLGVALCVAALSFSPDARACQPPMAPFRALTDAPPFPARESDETREAARGGAFWLLGDVPIPLRLTNAYGQVLELSTVVYRSEQWTALRVPPDALPAHYAVEGGGSLEVKGAPPPAPLPLTLGTPVVEADELRMVDGGCGLFAFFLPVDIITSPYLRVRLPLAREAADLDRLRVDAWVVAPGAARDAEALHLDAAPLYSLPGFTLYPNVGELVVESERRAAYTLHLRLVDTQTGERGEVVVIELEHPGDEEERQVIGLFANSCAAASPSGALPLALLGLGLLWRRNRLLKNARGRFPAA